jgi:hypothetical protein
MTHTSRSVKRRVKRRASKSVKRKLKTRNLRSKTYSKSKRSFQTGGTIPLNWSLDEWKADIEQRYSDVWRYSGDTRVNLSNFFNYSQKEQNKPPREEKNNTELYDISKNPQTQTLHANAFGISFNKSALSFLGKGTKCILKIEIDVNIYRYDLVKLVNSILNKLFVSENDEDVLPLNYLQGITSYDRMMESYLYNIDRKNEVRGATCPRDTYFFNPPGVANAGLPAKHCEIEIDITFTADTVTINSIKYTCVNSPTSQQCWQGSWECYLYLKTWAEYTNESKVLIKRAPKSIEVLKQFYNSSGTFHVSVFEFWKLKWIAKLDKFILDKYTDFHDRTKILRIVGFDDAKFTSERETQLEYVDGYIKANTPTQEEEEKEKKASARAQKLKDEKDIYADGR